MVRRQERLGLTELALMDVDADRLDIIGELAQAEQDRPPVSAETGQAAGFKIVCTTDARRAGRRRFRHHYLSCRRNRLARGG